MKEEILALLLKIWSKNPDLRFNQLISNLNSSYDMLTGHKHGAWYIDARDIDYPSERYITDLYYLGDEKYIDFLKTKI